MRIGELPPTILIIMGISGDLSRRYILPAIEELFDAKVLPKKFRLAGVSRRSLKLEEIFADDSVLKKYSQIYKLDYESPKDYIRLKSELDHLASELGPNCQLIFYVALPPDTAQTAVAAIGQAGISIKNVRLLLEKPFGKDLASARKLIRHTQKFFSENQLFMIDHYLAKEMAQNLVVFLGGNVLFRDVWNNKYIEKIDVVVSEQIGVEGRGSFYEQTGALRDIIQSHALQLLALVLMQPAPDLFDFSKVPTGRLKAIESLKVKNLTSTVRAQYHGYRAEIGNPDSTVETFVSVAVSSQDPRWQGVDITLTSGKRLNKKLTAIDIYFKKDKAPQANKLTLRVQPDEGVELDLWVKEPGYGRKLQKLPLSFTYGQHFSKLPQAYEQILLDAFSSDQSLFASSEEVLASWQVLEPVLRHWKTSKYDLRFYKPGSTISEVLS